MDTALAFAMGEAHRNDPLMVFDWDDESRRGALTLRSVWGAVIVDARND